jgi:hypothetical protein
MNPSQGIYRGDQLKSLLIYFFPNSLLFHHITNTFRKATLLLGISANSTTKSEFPYIVTVLSSRMLVPV